MPKIKKKTLNKFKESFVMFILVPLIFIIVSYTLFFISVDSQEKLEKQQKECIEKGDVPIGFLKYDPLGINPPRLAKIVCFDVS